MLTNKRIQTSGPSDEFVLKLLEILQRMEGENGQHKSSTVCDR